MNVWIKKCHKQAACKYCPKPIVNGEYMVVCKYYRKTKSAAGDPQKWGFFMRFHPQCWIDRAVAELESRVYTETRGRKKIEMLDETRVARLKIMMRHAAVVQRIKREVEKSENSYQVDRIIHLGEMLGKLKEEIEPLGGIPKSWE